MTFSVIKTMKLFTGIFQDKSSRLKQESSLMWTSTTKHHLVVNFSDNYQTDSYKSIAKKSAEVALQIPEK